MWLRSETYACSSFVQKKKKKGACMKERKRRGNRMKWKSIVIQVERENCIQMSVDLDMDD